MQTAVPTLTDLDWSEDDDPTDVRPLRPAGARVLVVDDDAAMRAMVRISLEREGYVVTEAASAAEVFERASAFDRESWPRGNVDLLLVDLRMPHRSGLEILSMLRTGRWTTPAILMTAFPDEDVHLSADFLGVPLLAKPFSLTELTDTALGVLLSRGFVGDSRPT